MADEELGGRLGQDLEDAALRNADRLDRHQCHRAIGIGTDDSLRAALAGLQNCNINRLRRLLGLFTDETAAQNNCCQTRRDGGRTPETEALPQSGENTVFIDRSPLNGCRPFRRHVQCLIQIIPDQRNRRFLWRSPVHFAQFLTPNGHQSPEQGIGFDQAQRPLVIGTFRHAQHVVDGEFIACQLFPAHAMHSFRVTMDLRIQDLIVPSGIPSLPASSPWLSPLA